MLAADAGGDAAPAVAVLGGNSVEQAGRQVNVAVRALLGMAFGFHRHGFNPL